ncbi:TlpA family protein disulfide reductase [Sphingobacterium sp. SG20118]|uniref:TlpA family protein disulfide reductase n=1 Tax=Sphingobacterium sp. SG20118 TaxID=3367156 RepID=UPI0037DFC8AC
MLLLFDNEMSRAQEGREVNKIEQMDLKPLKAGDQIPDAVWEMSFELHDLKGGSRTIQFKDLKGMVILFDFWSTTCSSCIQGFPKMEELQKKYGKDLAIILVNSKRNKDTPKRLKAVFDNYKRTYDYEMSLPSMLDDTVFTSIFPHYSIPTHAWVDRKGKVVGVDKGNDDLEKRVKSLIVGEQVDILEMGVMINEDRSYNPALVDTVGKLSTSIFAKPVPNFFPTQTYAYYNNGHTHFQLGNHTLKSILQYTFSKELMGFSLYQFVFDPQLKQGNHFHTCQALNDVFWYEMYRADSVGSEQVRDLVKADVMRFFQLEVVRKQELKEVYELELLPVFSKMESKVGMLSTIHELKEDGMQLNNLSIRHFLNLLFPYLDRPVLFLDENNINFNILLPKGFINFSLSQKLSFLARQGLHFKPVKKVIEYPYFKKTN